MSRSLRARKEIDYSQLFTFEDDDPTAGGSSTSAAPRKPLIIEEDDSGSDFEVGKAGEPVEEEEDDDDGKSAVLSDVDDGDVMMHNVEGDDADDVDDVVVGVVAKAAASKASVARSIAQRGTVQLAPGLAHKSRRQMHARPLPSVHHRHRFLPLIRRVAPVERLVARPLPFPPLGTNGVVDHTMKTKSGTADNIIIDRTNRACGYNVGPGPVWELVEDRAWFKEARTGGEDEWMEACRRPLVYSDLVHEVDVKVLSFEWVVFWMVESCIASSSVNRDARPFLPHGGDVNPNSESPAPLPSVPCYMGPVKNQTLVDLPTLKSKPMCQLSLPSILLFSETHVATLHRSRPLPPEHFSCLQCRWTHLGPRLVSYPP
jgi:transcription factor C subunit 6